MPDRTPYGAYSQFVTPLERALACVARTKMLVTPRGDCVAGREYRLVLSDDHGVRLHGEPRMLLSISFVYEIVQVDSLFKVHTKWYQHALRRAESDTESEIVGYHWHPGGNSHEDRPHVHVGTSQLREGSAFTRKGHIMTSRCSAEQVIRTAIEFGAEPLCADWSERLDQGHQDFVEYRTWH